MPVPASETRHAPEGIAAYYGAPRSTDEDIKTVSGERTMPLSWRKSPAIWFRSPAVLQYQIAVTSGGVHRWAVIRWRGRSDAGAKCEPSGIAGARKVGMLPPGVRIAPVYLKYAAGKPEEAREASQSPSGVYRRDKAGQKP